MVELKFHEDSLSAHSPITRMQISPLSKAWFEAEQCDTKCNSRVKFPPKVNFKFLPYLNLTAY